MNEKLKNIILFNLIDYMINTSKHKTIPTNTNQIKDPDPEVLWKYLMNTLKVSQLLSHLLISIKDAVTKEDYLNAHALKKEAESNFHFEETVYLKTINSELERFYKGFVKSELMQGCCIDVDILSQIKNGITILSLSEIICHLDEIRNYIYQISPDVIFVDAANMILKMKYTHPLIAIDRTRLLLKLAIPK